jgi:hypothetical protein
LPQRHIAAQASGEKPRPIELKAAKVAKLPELLAHMV